MIIIACRDCGTAIRVTGEHQELEQLLGAFNTDWFPDKYPCPTAICQGKACFVSAIEPDALRMLTVYDLTPHEAYAAFHGLGLPDERDCGPTAVKEALLKYKIADVSISLIRGSNRSVIYNLTLENGSVIYLGSSPFGAVVYRMATYQPAQQRVHEG